MGTKKEYSIKNTYVKIIHPISSQKTIGKEDTVENLVWSVEFRRG